MRIGLDIDGTINNLDDVVRPIIKEQYNIITYPTQYELFPGMTEEQIHDFHVNNKNIFIDDIKPIKNSQYIINELYNDGHYIYVITARHKQKMYDMTMKWFKKNNFKTKAFKDIFFDVNEKHGLCNLLNIDFMIEDCPKHLEDLYNHNIKTIRFDHLYNQNNHCCFHSDDWLKIYDYLKTFNG